MRKKRTRAVILICILCGLTAIGGLRFWGMIPKKDILRTDALPREFKIDADGNYIDFQTENACSAYASAFVMRHLGKQTVGPELYGGIHRILGFVPVSSVVSLFQNYGYNAAAYHGDMDTLKGRLLHGVPVIAFVSIPGDTHYVVIVGYDEDFVYLADSIPENTNADGGWYNRKLTTGEFEQIWRTNMYPVKNIYIVAEPQ